jgi:hypothetical protein
LTGPIEHAHQSKEVPEFLVGVLPVERDPLESARQDHLGRAKQQRRHRGRRRRRRRPEKRSKCGERSQKRTKKGGFATISSVLQQTAYTFRTAWAVGLSIMRVSTKTYLKRSGTLYHIWQTPIEEGVSLLNEILNRHTNRLITKRAKN